MNFGSFFKLEGKAKKLYPVIHVRDVAQATQNAAVAFHNGADGVFLINHDITGEALLLIAAVIRGTWPSRFIGINLLDAGPPTAFGLVSQEHRDLNALWVDDSGIGDRIFSFADQVNESMRDATWNGYYFASVAFKGRLPVADVAAAAACAERMAHVVVTSGDRTSSPPEVSKIRDMKDAIPGHPLAIASGMTCKNIHQFLPYADIFMVATGISDKTDNLDARLVERMVGIIKNYNKSAGLL